VCACGCFLLAAIVGALVYAAMHGLWLLALAVLVVAALTGWFSRKMAAAPKSTRQ